MDVGAAHALGRFGFGRRGTEPVPTEPRAWLRAQLRQADPASSQTGPDLGLALAGLRTDRQNKSFGQTSQGRNNFQRDALAALNWAVVTPAPFRERLVWFWTNHFTVSRRRVQCEGLIGPFIAEAIRPHVTGRFETMLLAVVRHPAMLIYLDNASSVGPSSRAGQKGRRGLNENLARECLELHTVSPAAGYTQADVTNFARILTGWSVDLGADAGNAGFRFRPGAHEPGSIPLMGRVFPPGEQGGIEALIFLANHPATHRHLATRTPVDFAIAALRANEPPSLTPRLLGALNLLGQPLWSAPQPNGWPDRAADWAAPEAMLRRIDFAYALAGHFGSQQDPEELAQTVLGPLLRPVTRDAVRRAGSRREAIALLLASPEFQRR
jgi:uncharacterized protein (DUF1800 family)